MAQVRKKGSRVGEKWQADIADHVLSTEEKYSSLDRSLALSFLSWSPVLVLFFVQIF